MLAYWTYFKRCDLMNFEWDAESVSKSAIKYLDTRQLAFLKGTIDCLKDKSKSAHLPGKHTNASQLTIASDFNPEHATRGLLGT